MINKVGLLFGVLTLSLGLVGTPSSWANSLTFQDVTFNLNAGAGNTLVLEINGVNGASGDWKGISGLASFAVGSAGVTSLSLSGWDTIGGGLNANGCSGSGASYLCLDFKGTTFGLSNNNTFTMTYAGKLDLTAPTLKVLFTGATQGDGHGNLLSKVVGVPEPGSLILLGAGLAGIGIWRRKSTQV